MNRTVKIIAAAIANARGGRRGMPPVENVLELLPPNLKDEVLLDAVAVVEAFAGLHGGALRFDGGAVFHEGPEGASVAPAVSIEWDPRMARVDVETAQHAMLTLATAIGDAQNDAYLIEFLTSRGADMKDAKEMLADFSAFRLKRQEG